MSRTYMFAAPKDGAFEEIAEFANAWGSAAFIWSSLSEKYFGNSSYWLLSISSADNDKFWDLKNNERLTKAEKHTFLSTFDRAVIDRANFKNLADCFNDFVKIFPPENRACHLNKMAEILNLLSENKDKYLLSEVNSEKCRAYDINFQPEFIAWHQTSVSENPWWVEKEVVEVEVDGRMYDFSKDNNHFLVFDT